MTSIDVYSDLAPSARSSSTSWILKYTIVSSSWVKVLPSYLDPQVRSLPFHLFVGCDPATDVSTVPHCKTSVLVRSSENLRVAPAAVGTSVGQVEFISSAGLRLRLSLTVHPPMDQHILWFVRTDFALSVAIRSLLAFFLTGHIKVLISLLSAPEIMSACDMRWVLIEITLPLELKIHEGVYVSYDPTPKNTKVRNRTFGLCWGHIL